MSLARYFVVQVADLWLVTLKGRTMGIYPKRRAAIDAAIVMADLMGAMNYDADVMVEFAPGRPLELVWSFGRDEMPEPQTRHVTEAQMDRIPPHIRRVQVGEVAA